MRFLRTRRDVSQKAEIEVLALLMLTAFRAKAVQLKKGLLPSVPWFDKVAGVWASYDMVSSFVCFSSSTAFCLSTSMKYSNASGH